MMQRFRDALLLLCIPFLLLHCNRANGMTAPLDSATTDISKALSAIDNSLADASRQLALTGLSGDEARKVLSRICSALPCSIDGITIDTTGCIVDVEPAEYRNIIGKNISDQQQVHTILKERKPVMSKLFKSVEGLYAMDAEYPVFNKAGKFTGAVSLLFSSDQLLRKSIEKAVTGSEVNIWVVDTNGIMLYDIMPEHIGLNLFTAPLYKSFPSLQKITRRIIKEPEGNGRYRFYRPRTKETVSKEAMWKTVSLYGKEWRIVACVIQPNKP